MLLGSRLPGPVEGWRFVEGDLYRIASQVREYDGVARLVREDGSGHLGLARWVDASAFHRGGWTFIRTIHDLDTDLPLRGEPDGRVLRWMRASDNRRIRSLREWDARSQDAQWRREAADKAASYDQNLDRAERFMNVMKKDVSARPKAFIGRGLPEAA